MIKGRGGPLTKEQARARRIAALMESIELADIELTEVALNMAKDPTMNADARIRAMQRVEAFKSRIEPPGKPESGHADTPSSYEFLKDRYGAVSARQHYERALVARCELMAGECGLPADSAPETVVAAATSKLAGMLGLPPESDLEACRKPIAELNMGGWPSITSEEPAPRLYWGIKTLFGLTLNLRMPAPRPERPSVPSPALAVSEPDAVVVEAPAPGPLAPSPGIVLKGDWADFDPCAPDRGGNGLPNSPRLRYEDDGWGRRF